MAETLAARIIRVACGDFIYSSQETIVFVWKEG